MQNVDTANQHSPSEDESSPKTVSGSAKKEHKSERDKRTYRACLHCRQRKSRCDLYSSGEPGRPPCERCIREQHECILGGSRRGGRRVKRAASDLSSSIAGPSPSSASHPFPPRSDFQHQPDNTLPRSDYQQQHDTLRRFPSWIDRESRVLPPLTQEPATHSSTPVAKMVVDDTVAATDLQNPADALEFLAHVAERNGSTQLPPIRPHRLSAAISAEDTRRSSDQQVSIHYPPLVNGLVSLEMMQSLLVRYEDKYHPFFPLANPAAMDPTNLPEIARKEPHLLAALLTVASKDEASWYALHEICSAHMQSLIADLVYSGRGSVEAVEAMLILAEWVPRRAHATPRVGRGEEDQAAWMYVGTAIRLGYLLGIDRTGFRTELEGEATAALNRKRLAWAACYMSDRQISVRIGKAFWSRGPGPMTALQAHDFPSLQPRPNRHDTDNFAAIFEANLELTQLFSNAHDVLYATKSRSNQLNFGGEYVKYIDDFRVALRSWHEKWGSLTCSPPLKASLILSYEYLRLYVNAFAYQATLNRLAAQLSAAVANGQPAQTAYSPFGADIAATPDARFIYDSIDAAKALLNTFNAFVDPCATFRYMPLRYYLYVIYSACFLYKARSTGVMGGGGEAKGSMRRMIAETVDRLQQSSACENDVGDRYSRLIRLLWRRPPGRGSVADGADYSSVHAAAAAAAAAVAAQQQQNQNQNQHTDQQHLTNTTATPIPMQTLPYDHQQQQQQPPPLTSFSWLDLPAVGDFALTNNGENSLAGSFDMEDSSTDGFGWDAAPGAVGGGAGGMVGMMGGMFPVGGGWGEGGEGVIF